MPLEKKTSVRCLQKQMADENLPLWKKKISSAILFLEGSKFLFSTKFVKLKQVKLTNIIFTKTPGPGLMQVCIGNRKQQP